MLDRIISIEVFLAIARSGSFTRTAEELGMSRAMVSKQFQALESALGVRLFNRSTRAIHLTEAGAAYRREVSPLLDALADVASHVGDLTSTPSGRLAVAAPTSFGLFHLSARIADYMNRFPDVDVHLMLTDRSVHLIDEGFDVAIQIGELDDSSLIARRLGEASMITCAAPAYLQRHGKPETPGALAGCDCLVFAENVQRNHGDWRFGTGKERETVRVPGAMVSNQGDALRIAAAAGRGIAHLP
jgi:DNA-binding transcriptional LysR family regulator